MVAQSDAKIFTGPSHHEIARLAYEIWLFEGRPAGRAVEHWGRAEQLLQTCYDAPAVPRRLAPVRASRCLSAATPTVMNRGLRFLASALA